MTDILHFLRQRRRLAVLALLLSTVLLMAASMGRGLDWADGQPWADVILPCVMLLGVAGQLLALLALMGKPRC
ncbi:hypothetical protein [Craterilacuibacter sp.]|uniref:hypothetical protein n=1 Tax=Craterilacuibacter sp. TaxID=2870909 RepID=UPI003F3554F6